MIAVEDVGEVRLFAIQKSSTAKLTLKTKCERIDNVPKEVIIYILYYDLF